MDAVSTGYISNQSTITGSELVRSIVLRMYPQEPEGSPLVDTLLVSDGGLFFRCLANGTSTHFLLVTGARQCQGAAATPW